MTKRFFSARWDWAITQGFETATFHILTPYPGTALYRRMAAQGRIFTSDWKKYDTRHAVFHPARISPEALEAGYWLAYRSFYSWQAIFQSSWTKPNLPGKLRHLAYTAGWKKAEPLWDWIIRQGLLPRFLPLLETILAGADRRLRGSGLPGERTEGIFAD